MSSYFKRQKGKDKVIGKVDPNTGEYLLSFHYIEIQDVPQLPPPFGNGGVLQVPVDRYETIAWNERSNLFTTFYSFEPEMYGRTATALVTFKDGKLWLHDSSDQRNNFYGVQYSSQVRFVANENPKVIKTWMNLAVKSNKVWQAAITNDNGQSSRLDEVDFENIKGVYWAGFLRDENTPNQEHPLLNGDDLESECLTLTLSNVNSEKVTLYWAHVRSIVSHFTTV
jgi:hypothetical protein